MSSIHTGEQTLWLWSESALHYTMFLYITWHLLMHTYTRSWICIIFTYCFLNIITSTKKKLCLQIVNRPSPEIDQPWYTYNTPYSSHYWPHYTNIAWLTYMQDPPHLSLLVDQRKDPWWTFGAADRIAPHRLVWDWNHLNNWLCLQVETCRYHFL